MRRKPWQHWLQQWKMVSVNNRNNCTAHPLRMGCVSIYMEFMEEENYVELYQILQESGS